MTTGTHMVRVEPEIEVAAESLIRVLVIDDEKDVRESWQRLFEGMGFSVDTAADPEGAIILLRSALMKKRHYHVIISDISFDNTSVTGDQLIAENHGLMGQARIVAITAYGRDRIKRLDKLMEMSVEVLEKGSGDDALEKIVIEQLEERKRQMATVAQESVQKALIEEEGIGSHETQPHTALFASEYLLNEIRQMLMNWFRTRKNPNKRSIVYGAKTFSPNELASEVERGTEVGREHLETMIDLFKDCLNLK